MQIVPKESAVLSSAQDLFELGFLHANHVKMVKMKGKKDKKFQIVWTPLCHFLQKFGSRDPNEEYDDYDDDDNRRFISVVPYFRFDSR